VEWVHPSNANTCTKVLALLYLTLLKVLFAPIGLRTRFRPMFAGVNLLIALC
jgi:hypothetical protein